MFKKALQTAFEEILGNRSLSLAAILVMSLTFLAASAFLLFAWGAGKIIDYYEGRALITAFFRDEATGEEIFALQVDLQNRPEVSEVKYTSKEEAFAIYLSEFQEDPSLLESITANIFPASLDIRTKSIEDLPEIAGELERNPLVEDVTFYKDIIERFKNLVFAARIGLFSLSAVLAIISVVVVLAIVGIAIFSHKEEIEIMRLLGASDAYIRTPFLLQGALYGFFAALISGILIALALPAVFPYFSNFFRDIPLSLPSWYSQLTILLGELFFGAALGAFSALLATNRYLKY